MSDVFDRAFVVVIGVEGGYVNDPRDPGGENKFGISKRAYPAIDIKGLTLDQAKAIYKRDIGTSYTPMICRRPWRWSRSIAW